MPDYQKFDQALAFANVLRSESPRGRYAPSPSGPLHLGNIRTALLAWLQTRLIDGVFVLRMEDLYYQRVQQGSAAQILADLKWLGLNWDEGPDKGGPTKPYTQSKRQIYYDTALHRLKQQRRIFQCFCSRKDIRKAASAPHSNDNEDIYPGTCRSLSASQIQQRTLRNPQRTPALRYRVEDKQIEFDDAIVGSFTQSSTKRGGDFVVRRADGLFGYHLAVVIDDALMGITDVLRGADLLDSTPRQLQLFSRFDFPIPNFWHVPLMMDERGRRMAKRDGSQSVSALRERRIKPQQVIGDLASSLDLVDEDTDLSPQELLQGLDLEKFKSCLQNHSKGV